MNEFNECTSKTGNAIAEFIPFAEEMDYNIATLLTSTSHFPLNGRASLKNFPPF
jgi:hypothetical protein